MKEYYGEQIKLQPLTNVGMIGHVDHGKTTLVEALTGIWAARHSEELKRGITIRLGYADTTIYTCPKCPPPQKYLTEAMLKKKKCPHCGSEVEFVRKISFVDVPGHEMLMAIMLSGATLMDGAILVIDASQPCPQPQTREHFMALDIIGVRRLIIVQNKVDIVPREQALENYKQIKEFVAGTWAEDAPIIPVSALHKVNIDVVVEAIEKFIPTLKRDPTKPPRMLIARSFDVNKPGTPPDKLVGGVIGGSIVQGKFKVGDEIEIRPGTPIIERDRKGRVRRIEYRPLFTGIASLKSGNVELKEAYPGGLIGIGTYLDPSLTKSDALRGNVAGKPGTLPPVWEEIEMEAFLLERVVGTPELRKAEPIRFGERLAINVGTAASLGEVIDIKGNVIRLKLRVPICAEKGVRIALSRQILGRWRLIGYGVLLG
ncbi:MAG: translation initiation factor IF-2 subunit gamma [Thermoprotei archaeon]|nr:MAG: translation initiation factor IF-2 subunit gamma [Thermoprotei archaeon]RLF02751.1 MAG: translation initiation factor IF-2 subunit gamma [Thermoprotei archaeon]